jgi:hypothetical protein
LLAALRKTRWFETVGVRVCSLAVGCLGLTWLVQRIGN